MTNKMLPLNIKWIRSPFYDTKRISTRLIVIHHTGSVNGIVNSFYNIVQWYIDESLHKNNKTSVHYIIPRSIWNGFDVVQFILERDVAYHIGDGKYTIDDETIKHPNRHSIGIKLQGDGNLFEYTDYQYNVLAQLTFEILKRHSNIRMDAVIGHDDISNGNCPGKNFRWKKYLSQVSELVTNDLERVTS